MPTPPSDLVVYDFDGTLVEGDLGDAFVRHLLRGWRRILALPLAPIGLILMAGAGTRRAGVSLFLRLASVGRTPDEMDALARRFAKEHPLLRRERELRWLDADLAAGRTVVIATGAFAPLARVALHRLGIDDRVRLVASEIEPAWPGVRLRRHCNGPAKLKALAAEGFPPPYAKAVSDSWADAPLLAASHEAILVNASPQSRRAVRRAVGGRLVDADGPG